MLFRQANIATDPSRNPQMSDYNQIMPFTYVADQWLPYPIDLVFAFFADPENLPRLMPSWQKARIDGATMAPPPPHPEGISTPAAGPGTRLTLTFRPVPFSPIRLHWDAEITEFIWNDHFCDIQLARGPFAFWRHCHTLRTEFRANAPGTHLRDEVLYTPPLGPLGSLAKPFITLQLDYMFRYRHTQTAKLLPRFAASLN